MSRSLLLLAACIFACLIFATHADAVSNFCPSGTCDIANPIYVNVYWDTSAQQWNSDIMANAPSATVDRLDALTNAICHSAYFSQLTQYSVASCKMLPSIVENGCGAVPSDLDKAHDKIGDFATCVISHHPDFDQNRTILNVFLPAQVAPASSTSEFCSTAGAQHDKYGSPVAVTFIPTSGKCNSGISGISASLTHEMVEATTDPVPQSPTGWKVIADGEVADQCENMTPSSALFMFGRVALYFSDSANACTSGISSAVPFTPAVTSATACGSGQQMKITLNGSFGTKPWDLASDAAGGSATMFLQAAISGSHNWNAGGIANFPVDAVGFGPVSWVHASGSDTITISGFDNKYGIATPGSSALVEPGDSLKLSVSSWLSGQSTSITLTAANPNGISNFRVTPDVHSTLPIYVGDQPTVDGKFVDSGNCAEQISDLVPASDVTSDTFYPVKGSTLSDGSFSFQYTPGSPAGTHHVSFSTPVAATLPVAVHPIADELSNVVGGVAGGQSITLTGKGFDPANTKVSFSGLNHTAFATNVSVSNDSLIHLTTPPSPLLGKQGGAGFVDVVATVNGQDSIALSYLYVVPNKPVLNFISNSCPFAGDQSINTLEVNAYNADGSNANETITLSTSYPAFNDGSTQLATSITVSPGASVSMKGVGPVTASPSADPALAITKTYKEGPLEPGCNPGAGRRFTVISFLAGPGPVENSVIAALLGQDGRSAAWVATPVAQPAIIGTSIAASRQAPAGDYLLFFSKEKIAPLAKAVTVQTLGLRDLKTLMREHPSAISGNAKDNEQVQFVGPNFDVQSRARGRNSKGVFATPAELSFHLPSGQDPKLYHILHLLPGGSTWSDTKTSLVDEQALKSIRAQVTEAGTYALARIKAKGTSKTTTN